MERKTAMSCSFLFFFFNDTATTEIYTLSLHDALPICIIPGGSPCCICCGGGCCTLKLSATLICELWRFTISSIIARSEEHTSELQSRLHLVCRLLLEKKKHTPTTPPIHLRVPH